MPMVIPPNSEFDIDLTVTDKFLEAPFTIQVYFGAVKYLEV